MDSGEGLVHYLLALDPVALELDTEKDNATIQRKLLQYKIMHYLSLYDKMLLAMYIYIIHISVQQLGKGCNTDVLYIYGIIIHINICNVFTIYRPQFGGNYCVGEARIYEICNTQVIILYMLSCSRFGRFYMYCKIISHASPIAKRLPSRIR